LFLSFKAHIYDAPTDTWAAVADTTYGRLWGSVVTFKNRIFALGGWSWYYGEKKFVEEYDPVLNKW
jgi:hypothetical protein